MRCKLVALIAFVALAAGGPLAVQAQEVPNADQEPTAARIAERVQRRYDHTRTFRAAFKQTYRAKIANLTKVSKGRVALAKKGKLSFRYDEPAGNRVVSDGRTIRIYERENRQLYELSAGRSQYPAALAFLQGDGNLVRDFALRKLDAAKMKVSGGYVLEAVPNEASPAYAKLLLYIDAATSQVRRVLLLDAQGNVNRFDFDGPVLNKPIGDEEFQFSPPPGTNIIHP